MPGTKSVATVCYRGVVREAFGKTYREVPIDRTMV